MWNWYSEYLLSRLRQLEAACAAEGSRRLKDLKRSRASRLARA